MTDTGMDTELVHGAAAAGAKWWADRLRDAVGVGDNGDQSSRGALGCVLTQMLRDRNPPTEDHCERFEQLMTTRLAQQLVRPTDDATWYRDVSGWDDGGVCIALRVDYHPCPLLRATLLDAGIERNVADVAALPLKTTMKVSRRRILVAHGYGARFAEIYGPLWGTTYEQQRRIEAAREEQRAAVFEAWIASGRSWKRNASDEWQGPIRE